MGFLAGARERPSPGVGNEPFWESLKGNHKENSRLEFRENYLPRGSWLWLSIPTPPIDTPVTPEVLVVSIEGPTSGASGFKDTKSGMLFGDQIIPSTARHVERDAPVPESPAARMTTALLSRPLGSAFTTSERLKESSRKGARKGARKQGSKEPRKGNKETREQQKKR